MRTQTKTAAEKLRAHLRAILLDGITPQGLKRMILELEVENDQLRRELAKHLPSKPKTE